MLTEIIINSTIITPLAINLLTTNNTINKFINISQQMDNLFTI